MNKPTATSVNFTLRYDGLGPVYWERDPAWFDLQDQTSLHQGRAEADGVMAFDFTLSVKPGASGAPVFTGDFGHGKPAERFLYLGWANKQGGFAQRLKVPLTIGWDLVERAQTTGKPLVATVVDKTPKATTTGANIGGTRKVEWAVG